MSLDHGAVTEIARFVGRHRTNISRIAHGHTDWRKVSPIIVRRLYDAGWSPPNDPNGRRTIRLHLNKLAMAVAIKPDTT